MGRYADKWERKMRRKLAAAIRRAQAVTAREYAEAMLPKLQEEGFTGTVEDLLNEPNIQGYVEEVNALDPDAIVRDINFANLAKKWSRNWVESYQQAAPE